MKIAFSMEVILLVVLKSVTLISMLSFCMVASHLRSSDCKLSAAGTPSIRYRFEVEKFRLRAGFKICL